MSLLVLAAFGGPKTGDTVLYQDGNPRNARFDNLRWGTWSELLAEAYIRGAIPRGTARAAAKLEDDKVREMRARHAAGEGFQALGDAYGVSGNAAREAVRRTTWAHVL